MTASETERFIWDKLLAAGLTPAGAAGLMGNLKAESGLNPKNLQNCCEKKLGYTDETYTAAVDCGAYAGFMTDGAGYELHGLEDWGADTVIQKCRDVSEDFSSIVPGEAVWMRGHIGIYVDGGQVVESTPRWKWGVQRSTCANVCDGLIFGTAGSRTWTKHGKLPWADYAAQENKMEEDEDMVYYKTLDDVPSWYEDAVRKAVDKGALNGTGNGELNVSEDLCRTLTVLDRLGVLG